MLTVIAVVLVFGMLIFFHELGHFLLAKRAGVLVYEFALGFGPKVVAFQRGETLYTIRAVPLGGFVRFAGLEPQETDVPPERSFKNKSIGQRMSVIAAGPIANFLLAAVLFCGVFLVQGFPEPTTTIDQVLPEEPAAVAGLQSGDRILAINGAPLKEWDELSARISEKPGEDLLLEVERDGAVTEIAVVAESAAGVGRIGISPEVEFQKVGILTALAGGVQYTYEITVLILTFLGQMIIGQAPPDVGGPVRIVSEIGTAAQLGLVPLLNLAAFLSINVGLFNLLPIPALDGSRLMFLAWEGISRKPLKPEKEGAFHLIGFALLLLLIAVVTYRDILDLIM